MTFLCATKKDGHDIPKEIRCKGWVNHKALQQMLAVVIATMNIQEKNLGLERPNFFCYDH